jgi:hypothetical protein
MLSESLYLLAGSSQHMEEHLEEQPLAISTLESVLAMPLAMCAMSRLQCEP